MSIDAAFLRTLERLARAEQALDRLSASERPPLYPYSNLVLNGDMAVWQENTTTIGIASGAYITDGWIWGNTSAAVVDTLQSTVVPTVAQSGRSSPFALFVDVTTADATVAAGDVAYIVQRIEGHEFIGAGGHVPWTLSWWARSTIPGIYCARLANGGGDRTWIAEYTIAAADTWQWFYTTFDTPPTAGTWNYTTGSGLSLSFTLMCGSTFQTTPGAWQTGNFLGTANQVNALSSSANSFSLSQVALVPGRVPVRLPTYSFQDELWRAQRYYAKTFPYGTVPAQNTGTVAGSLTYATPHAGTGQQGQWWALPRRMRVTPTITTYNPSAANANWRNRSAAADSGAAGIDTSTSTSGVFITDAGAAGNAVDHLVSIHATASARL